MKEHLENGGSRSLLRASFLTIAATPQVKENSNVEKENIVGNSAPRFVETMWHCARL